MATSYAIEALRVFDHLHFRSNMQDASDAGGEDSLLLKKPTSLSGKPSWFENFYVKGSQAESDRKLFSH